MCGIACIIGAAPERQRGRVAAMVGRQRHRGPDGLGIVGDRTRMATLGHNRLSIIDLSPGGLQPMGSPDGRYRIIFNGEIYNHPELRSELAGYPFRGRSDTEVLLAAWEKWGEGCLDRLYGMFAVAIWDEREQRLFAARDRFGVKPLYYHREADGTLLLASEIKALHAAGVAARPELATWATWLASGRQETGAETFWEGVRALRPGHSLSFADGCLRERRWYRLEERVGKEPDQRPEEVVAAEYLELLRESVRLRLRAEVPVGISLSGGLDSSLLYRLVEEAGRAESIAAFTFTTGDPRYDELPWVERMLAGRPEAGIVCQLGAEEVPGLAAAIEASEDEPFGGLPTIAYAGVFAQAWARGIVVMLDGQGMDEQWAGYDYYAAAADGAPGGAGGVKSNRASQAGQAGQAVQAVQGSREPATRPAALTPESTRLIRPFTPPQPFSDRLRNLQYQDLCLTKLPRALRFNERISMRSSTELREPFLDHRLVELAMRQPAARKIRDGSGKWLLRQIAARLIPAGLPEAPKRPVQTPQREWLRGPLRDWTIEMTEAALAGPLGGLFIPAVVRQEREKFLAGAGDNSLFIWQWISAGLAGARVKGGA